MLTKPVYGWSDFQLDGTSTYGLSYLDDIAFEWVDQAIHGLETNDINQNIDEWISFTDYEGIDAAKRRGILIQKLRYLNKLISEKEEWFGENRCLL